MTEIRLEPFGREHVGSLGSLLADPETLRFTRVPVPVPAGFASTWVERYEEGRRDGTREAFAILDAASGDLLGLTMAPKIDREELTAELGYAVAPEARGRGIAREALRFMTGWAFELGMQRLELLIGVDNPASKRVAESCGYVFEGVLRSTYFKGGQRADTEIWSRLPTDP